jgi:hypothetical protein
MARHALHRALAAWRAACLLYVMLLQAAGVHAQDTAFYGGIERYAARHGFTRWLYGTVFVQPERDQKPPAPGTPQRRSDPLLPFAGRIVRSVDVVVLDPFGHELMDSTAAPESWVLRAGNSLHRRTREYLVREFVLVKHGEAFDPLKAAESERLLRAASMVNDALVTALPVAGGTDSVDVRVLVLDQWSIEAWAERAGGAVATTLLDRNLLGLGQRLELRNTSTSGDLLERFEADHRVYNIRGTYIGSQLGYTANGDDRSAVARLERTFYSPLTRWAGAAGWSWRAFRSAVAGSADGGMQRIAMRGVDSWLGRSFMLGRGQASAVRSSTIVAGLRYATDRYPERPAAGGVGPLPFPNVDQALLSVGLSVRQYYRERFLYRFGAVEDVPEGLLVKLTGGMRDREGDARMAYSGAEISRGRHYSGFGYAAVALGAGTYWQGGMPLDATCRAELRYFTDLLRLGRWYLRQFASISGASITRRLYTERMDLNGDILFGFQSARVSGTHRELLKLETVAYAPWKVLGFRFAPVLLAGFATIGDAADPLFSGRIHSALGLGLLLRNEHLLVRTFQVTLNVYPHVPGEAGGVFDAGRYDNYTLRAPDFAFTQPAVVGY